MTATTPAPPPDNRAIPEGTGAGRVPRHLLERFLPEDSPEEIQPTDENPC